MRRTMRCATVVLAMTTAMIGASMADVASAAPKPKATTTGAMPKSLGLVATNPWAARQPTAWGRRLGAVEYLDGQVYVGYGDWGANTGPTQITSWSAQDAAWVEHLTADTEAIESLRTIGETMYVPMIDPRGNTADVAVSGPWHARSAGSAASAFQHVFDVAETADGLWMVGSKNGLEAALVMRSTDGGATWAESLVVPGPVNRFYSAAVLDGTLHVQDQYGTYRFVDGSWSSAPPIAETSIVHDAVSVPGAIASIGYYGPGWLYVFDGTQATTSSESDWLSLTESDGVVYALRSGSVVSSTDLVNWTTVTRKVPSGAVSLAVGGGYLWFGTDASQLWAAPLR
jgi:hypothetical protein